jgi:hypothetical protein
MNPRAWTLSILLAPVLYVLTLPPMVILLEPRPRVYIAPLGSYSAMGYKNLIKEPHWTDSYGEPYRWLMVDSPVRDQVGKPLEGYLRWWEGRLRPWISSSSRIKISPAVPLAP